MRNRILETFRTSRTHTFFGLFIASFLYKFAFCWPNGIASGWQDELAWKQFADSSGFVKTLVELDSGYPAPLVRALSYGLANMVNANYIVWHLVILIIISMSIASIAFSRITGFESRIFIAGLLVTFPSFDLLLLHNVSYWTFIPLFALNLELIAKKTFLTNKRALFILVLILCSTKPQLLAVTLFMLLVIYSISKNSRRLLILPIATTFFMLVSGRLSSNSIELDISHSTALNFIITITSHLVNVFLPLLLLFAFRISKNFEMPSLISAYFFLANCAAVTYFWKNLKHLKAEKRLPIYALVFVIYAASLYIFPNSGWSNASLLKSYDSVSLFSRHYLPVTLFVSYFVAVSLKSQRFLFQIFSIAILQNTLLQVFLYTRLYKPM